MLVKENGLDSYHVIERRRIPDMAKADNDNRLHPWDTINSFRVLAATVDSLKIESAHSPVVLYTFDVFDNFWIKRSVEIVIRMGLARFRFEEILYPEKINNEDIPSETNSSELSEGSETALYILSSPLHVNVLNDFANELLRTFIQHCINLYGRRFVFVVVKFLSTDNDKDEYYEVALSKWLQDLDENMIGSILWPGDNSTAGMLVRTQVNAQSNWSIYAVEVKRYYDTYLHARKGLAEVIEYASAYETDTGKEMGRGKRKKKKNPITSSSESDNDQHLENQVKKKKPSIPSPPAIHVPEASTSVDKISSHKGKRNIIEDSSNIKESKVARHLGKPISSENNRQKLIEKIINNRKELEGISSKLEVVIMNQTNLNRSLLPEQAVINRPSNLPSLPLSDIKSLEEFEKFLSNDSLALGNNEKTATSKLMTQLMTNSLAVHFNFDGHNPQKAMTVKRSFKQLKLWELFQEPLQHEPHSVGLCRT
ncbi:hypothetical protein DBV15_07955 [Temnothorax longispinosus]|uniref:Uncharacterized protein n=1 Tax=Temnothorax longispinosus TaxID=300112 RepID=A0A4S2KSR3_9HYME|nr:hypothetical protein DBV15_07955 [Temnothorax longispinosus]